ncbi:MAG: hypothetical protein ACR2N3_04720 [Pyrinomonadaceae bacterium]
MDEEIQQEQDFQPAEDDVNSLNDADQFINDDTGEIEESIEDKMAKLEEQNRRLYARLQKTKDKPEVTVKETVKVEPKKKDDDEIDRLRLEARGFLDESEQDIILKYSKGLGIPLTEAVKDDLITSKIEKMRQDQKTENAIPNPSGKAASQKHDVEYYISKGELPDDEEMFEKVQTELVRRGKNNIKITNPND